MMVKRTVIQIVALFLPWALMPAGVNAGEPFRLQAHRGISNRFPENTLISFTEAGKVPVYRGMETDVQMTSDGVLVCMHDKTLDRTADAEGKVSDYTFSQLQEFWIDGGYGWGDEYRATSKIPLFSDYLEVCLQTGLIPYVELKQLQGDGVRKTVEMLESYNLPQGYVLTSFNLDYLKEASRHTSAPLEYMKKNFKPEDVDACDGIDNILIRPNSVRITDELVEYCRSKGLRMECYGIPVGDKKLVIQLRKWGIEGGTCNDWRGLGMKRKDYRK
ncbi:MAG: glycerophosphodiester phosphodiesterase [Candidatus Cryptobacteroides sp.]